MARSLNGTLSQPTSTASAQVQVAAARWEDAVRAAAHLLVAQGAAEPRYEDRCVAIVAEQGPYIVVAPGIALAHARPEDGALGVGVAAAVLARPVAFGHPTNDPVDVVLAFASPDKDAHLGLLAHLATALVEGLAEGLRTSASSEEATARLKEAVT